MIVTIHQPNFLPWLPFFEKIKSSDVFVFLNHCQFEKNNYQNRFFYRDSWRTMSVNKGLEPIVQKKYVSPLEDWKKIKVNLKDKKWLLDQYDECISESLWTTNHDIIMKTLKLMNIKTHIEYDFPTEKKSNERLIEICKKLGATTYLAGTGGKNYMNLELWKEEGINVVFQEVNENAKIHTLDFLGDRR